MHVAQSMDTEVSCPISGLPTADLDMLQLTFTYAEEQLSIIANRKWKAGVPDRYEFICGKIWYASHKANAALQRTTTADILAAIKIDSNESGTAPIMSCDDDDDSCDSLLPPFQIQKPAATDKATEVAPCNGPTGTAPTHQSPWSTSRMESRDGLTYYNNNFDPRLTFQGLQHLLPWQLVDAERPTTEENAFLTLANPGQVLTHVLLQHQLHLRSDMSPLISSIDYYHKNSHPLQATPESHLIGDDTDTVGSLSQFPQPAETWTMAQTEDEEKLLRALMSYKVKLLWSDKSSVEPLLQQVGGHHTPIGFSNLTFPFRPMAQRCKSNNASKSHDGSVDKTVPASSPDGLLRLLRGKAKAEQAYMEGLQYNNKPTSIGALPQQGDRKTAARSAATKEHQGQNGYQGGQYLTSCQEAPMTPPSRKAPVQLNKNSPEEWQSRRGDQLGASGADDPLVSDGGSSTGQCPEGLSRVGRQYCYDSYNNKLEAFKSKHLNSGATGLAPSNIVTKQALKLGQSYKVGFPGRSSNGSDGNFSNHTCSGSSPSGLSDKSKPAIEQQHALQVPVLPPMGNSSHRSGPFRNKGPMAIPSAGMMQYPPPQNFYNANMAAHHHQQTFVGASQHHGGDFSDTASMDTFMGRTGRPTTKHSGQSQLARSKSLSDPDLYLTWLNQAQMQENRAADRGHATGPTRTSHKVGLAPGNYSKCGAASSLRYGQPHKNMGPQVVSFQQRLPQAPTMATKMAAPFSYSVRSNQPVSLLFGNGGAAGRQLMLPPHQAQQYQRAYYQQPHHGTGHLMPMTQLGRPLNCHKMAGSLRGLALHQDSQMFGQGEAGLMTGLMSPQDMVQGHYPFNTGGAGAGGGNTNSNSTGFHMNSAVAAAQMAGNPLSHRNNNSTSLANKHLNQSSSVPSALSAMDSQARGYTGAGAHHPPTCGKGQRLQGVGSYVGGESGHASRALAAAVGSKLHHPSEYKESVMVSVDDMAGIPGNALRRCGSSPNLSHTISHCSGPLGNSRDVHGQRAGPRDLSAMTLNFPCSEDLFLPNMK